MDPITARLWESSRFRGNALLLLILIGHSIAEKNRRPKLDTLAARLKLSRRQTERLESELVESQELQIIEPGGRGIGNLYDIPAIRDLLDAALRAEFAAHDARRLADALGESPTDPAAFVESPSQTSGFIAPTETTGQRETPPDLSDFGLESPTDPADKAESPTVSTRIQSRVSLSLNTNTKDKEERETGGAGEAPTRGRRRGRTPVPETPFPDDFALDETDQVWAAENVPGLDVETATGSWADTAKARGWTFKDWKAAWRNGMRKAYGWAVQDGRIKPPQKPKSPAADTSQDQAEYEQTRQLLNQPCEDCGGKGTRNNGPNNIFPCGECGGSGKKPFSKILAEIAT